MSVSKDISQGTWTVYARYTDWQGNGSAIPWTKEYQQAYANFVADVAKKNLFSPSTPFTLTV